jgi:hypothetical protein
LIKKIIFASFLILQSVVWAAYAPEIGQLNLGAKPVGLGNAMTALSGDVNSLYYNPAGLAPIKTIQGHLFATQSLNEINQMTVGGVLPLEFGTFGIGWSNYAVDGISLGTSPAALTSGSFAQSVTYFSLAMPIGEWSWGATIKYFSAAGTGAGLSNAGASGYDLDLGMQAPLTSDLRLGVLFKNVLPSTQGNSLGSLLYQSGTTEGFLGSLHVGAAYEFYKKQLIFSGELIGYEANQYPLGYGFGVDFKFTKTLTLRGSYSTVPVPAGTGMPPEALVEVEHVVRLVQTSESWSHHTVSSTWPVVPQVLVGGLVYWLVAAPPSLAKVTPRGSSPAVATSANESPTARMSFFIVLLEFGCAAPAWPCSRPVKPAAYHLSWAYFHRPWAPGHGPRRGSSE